jgi:alpha-glucosidase (family GH31 glycosyl hydrolase)
VDKLLQHKVPLAAVWIQDWVGLRKAFDGDRLRWNWQLDSAYYPNWHETVKNWGEEHGIRVMTYINPFFSETEGDKVALDARNLYQEGVQNGYFVQSPQGGAYKMHSGSIQFCMLDTTNPTARQWMKDVMKKDMIEGSGSAGWMADFGEYLPFDAVLAGGQNAAEYHNVYPEEWAKLNAEAVAEAALEKKSHLKLKRRLTNGIKESKQFESKFVTEDREVVYFVRSAGLKSPAHTSLFWLGDQLVSWDRHDGLKSAIVGALSGGIGGHSITHSDIGGYTMVSYIFFVAVFLYTD